MDKDEVVVCQPGEIFGYLSTNAMGLSVILEVFVVSEDGDRVRGSGKEVSPVVKASDHSEELTVVDVIVAFGLVECFGVVAHHLLFSSTIFLCEDSTSGKC